MSFSLGEYQDIFLEEADEQLQELNSNLLKLEKDPNNIEIINDIFRTAHSLKSSAGFVGLNELSNLAHKMENLLQGIRDGMLRVTPEIINIIFKCFDVINSIIETVASGEQPTHDLSRIIEEIQRLGNPGQSVKETKPVKQKEKTPGIIKTNVHLLDLNDNDKNEIFNRLSEGGRCCILNISIDKTAQMKWVKAQLILGNLGRIGKVIKTEPSPGDLSDDDPDSKMKIIFCTDRNNEFIKNACDIDLINRVECINIITSRTGNAITLQVADSLVFIGTAEPSTEIVSFPGIVYEPVQIAEDKALHSDESDESDDYDISEIQFGRRMTDRADTDKKKAAATKTVKVSIEKLDQLLNNVGELVIANSGFFRIYEELRKITGDKSIVNEFKNRMEGMSRIAKDLQTGIMKTRMVQIGQIFNRFKRLVRDLTKEFKKEIELVIKGEDTELDKKVIDAIGEPLLHLIRNAVDHGVETTAMRKEMGKSETAKITLNAYQGGNHILVEVSDDGKGLDIEKIKKKAIDRGLVNIETVANMDSSEIFNFIFSPGFSTADKVTDLSGRGVGMTVVKQIVSELNGAVTIETEPGMGTRFILTFPLTLAIIPAIMVRVQKELYAIPLSDVVETIKISTSDITTIEGHEVINLRGEILSLLRLNQFIKIKSSLKTDSKIPVVVVGYGNRKIGLIVDFLEGKLEIVIKSLEQNYKTIEGLAGASILGDGSICLILDIATMINKVIFDQEKLTRVERRQLSEKKSNEGYELAESSDYDPGELSIADISENFKSSKPIIFDVEKNEEKPDAVAKEIDYTQGPRAIMFDEPEQISSDKNIHDDSLLHSEKPPMEGSKPQVLSDIEINKKIKDTLSDFRNDLKERVSSTLQGGDIGDHIKSKLNISKEDLNEFQIIANIGATNAAESMSQILKKRIELSIPMVEIKPIEKIPEYIGSIESSYIGVMMTIHGEIKGTILFLLNDVSGFDMVDLLYGTTSREKMELDEDGKSALSEITNIIGSSVINVIAEKTGMVIKPDVPVIVHDYLLSIIDTILATQSIQNDYAIIMDTTFFFQDDKLIGNLLYFPDSDSLKTIVEGLRANVGSN